MCSDNWDKNWSDLTCHQLGYADSVNTRYMPNNDLENNNFWYLNNSHLTPEPIQKLGDSNEVEACNSQTEVEIECQEFGKNIKSGHYSSEYKLFI